MPKKIVFSEDQSEEILNKYNLGIPCDTIATDLNCSRNTISRHLLNLGLRYPKRKYTLNEEYFDVIDTEDKAYFLGLLYADGCVSSSKCVSIELQERDKEILDLFQKFLGSDYPLYRRNNSIRGSGNWQDTFILSITSTKIVESLVKLGCVPRKSLILRFPNREQVSEHLIHHFIRGYFDGDGTCGVGKYTKSLIISFTGTSSFMSSVQCFLCYNTGCNLNKIVRRHNAFSLQYSGNIVVPRIVEYLYKDSTICIKRKKNKLIL